MRTLCERRDVQRPLIRLLAWQGVQAVHVPNGVQLGGDQLARVKQASALKADGVLAGFPDLICFDTRTPGRACGFIECKIPAATSVLSEEQIKVRDWLIRLGFAWALARRPEDGVEILKTWGWR